MFVRSLFVQASWNFATMQSAGFFLVAWPALSRRLPAPAAVAAGLRHMKHFNTHPYFAGLVAAVVAREEELGTAPQTVDGLKHSLMCALGAVGDEFFWAHLRPLATLAALPAALAGLAWAPLVLLAIYNVPHLGVRWWGAAAGLAQGRGILGALERRLLTRALPALGIAIPAVAGFLVGAFPAHPAWGLFPSSPARSLAAAAAVFALLAALVSRGLPPQRLLAGGVVAAIAAGTLAVAAGP